MLRENKKSPEIKSLHESAKRYCYLIENVYGFNNKAWLSEISLLLPRIHAVISLIDGHQRSSGCVYSLSDMDSRFDFFCQLKSILGNNDDYEVGEEAINKELYGSLAEDLTDLYFEIKRGLSLIGADDEGIAAALNFWRDGFFIHWGKHLIDAQRHLYNLRAQHQI